MIALFVTGELVKKEYEKKYSELLNILRNSESKSKDIEEEKILWNYSFSYFRKKGENTPEYYESLFKMPFDERYEAEMKRVRVSIGMTAGYFFIQDRVDGVSQSIAEAVKAVTAQKMVNEQQYIGDMDVINSIPFLKKEETATSAIPKPMSLQEQLKHAIEIEDYEDAARIRDEMKKLHE